MADDLSALLDHLQINSAHVLGWSMGGLIAQQFALTRPLRVRKLILISTTNQADGFFRLAIKNWINVRRSDMSFEQIVRFVSRWGYSPAFYDNDQVYEKLIEVTVANPCAQKSHAFLRQADALLAYNTGEAASGIMAQTLVVAGIHDNLLPPYHAESLAKAIPGATLSLLSGAHNGFNEFPSEYNRVILDFLL
jgi:3-oxoadipate enol-lactonase